MKNIILLIQFLSFFILNAKSQNSYTFNYYSVYDCIKNNEIKQKSYYFSNSENDNYALYITTSMEGLIYDAEIIDMATKEFIKVKFKKNTFFAINDFKKDISHIERLSFSKIFKFRGNTYSKISEVKVEEFSHIKYNLYSDRKKKNLTHSILLETKPYPNFVNQFKTRSLFFTYYNYVDLINYKTTNVITKIYRYNNEILVFEENLIDINRINIVLTLN